MLINDQPEVILDFLRESSDSLHPGPTCLPLLTSWYRHHFQEVPPCLSCAYRRLYCTVFTAYWLCTSHNRFQSPWGQVPYVLLGSLQVFFVFDVLYSLRLDLFVFTLTWESACLFQLKNSIFPQILFFLAFSVLTFWICYKIFLS